ncbi:cytochrome b561 domain-containing protein 2-like [Photinus pyralis]|uniref:cytochrome b561 domain-containing protein 2-like n=1 Tax=Photinus pyralis TaxID=7054 RepID=UPI0012677EE8|nr:cytochrome b561 domain-containing protein 2-like [Photinus pyralis]
MEVNSMTSRLAKIGASLTMLVHVFILSYCVFIVYLCLSNEVVLFTWHPLLLALGWILLMGEGILVFNSHNTLIKHLGLTHKGKVRAHWIIQGVAISLSVSGYIIVYVNKDLNGKRHLHSWHGIFGFVSIISCIPVIVSGVTALYNYRLKSYISPVNNKLIHRICGVFTYSVGFATMLLSLYTHWFQRKVDTTVMILWFVILCVIIIWCLISPYFKVFNRLKLIVK